jgi:hypothetical protein
LTHVDPVLTPKVGFGRWVGLRYGRNFHLGPFRFSEIGDDCFELFIRLYFPAFNQLTQNYQTAL